jgi:hypothetical protein
MTNSNPTPSLHRKLAEVMAEIRGVQNDKRNTNQNYGYVSDAALVKEVRDRLASRQITVIPRVVPTSIVVIERPKGPVTTFAMEYVFTDGESGEQVIASTVGQGFDMLDKGAYKAMTGALKYVLRQTFLIPTGDDAEAPTPHDSDEPTQKQRDTAKNLLATLRLDGDERDLILTKHGIQAGVPASRDQYDAVIAELIDMAQKTAE